MLRAALVMSKSSRQSKSEGRLAQLETEFVEKLVTALSECAAGRWGLFGQNDQVFSVRSVGPELVTLGEEIRGLRAELGFTEGFHPYQRFLDYRAMSGANISGEPKLAMLLLRELEAIRLT